MVCSLSAQTTGSTRAPGGGGEFSMCGEEDLFKALDLWSKGKGDEISNGHHRGFGDKDLLFGRLSSLDDQVVIVGLSAARSKGKKKRIKAITRILKRMKKTPWIRLVRLKRISFEPFQNEQVAGFTIHCFVENRAEE